MDLEIVLYPDPVLRKPVQPIEAFGPELAALGRAMLELMYKTQGVGLAAPQVGRSLSLLVLNPSGDKDKPEEELILLNPRIVSRKGREWGLEGCLSFPGIYAEILRAERIVVEARGPDGEEVRLEAEEFLARVIQHEMDHLGGTLFTDRMTPAEKIKVKKDLETLEARFAEANAALRERP